MIYLLGALFIVWILVNQVAGLAVTNWYEYIVAYIAVILPVAIILFFMSREALQNQEKWKKVAGWAGVFVSVVSVLWASGQLLYIFSLY